MKILVIGSNGQLGWELRRTCPSYVELACVDFPELDICNRSCVHEYIFSLSPDWIINAAAYTAVDKAEQEHDKAYDVNCRGAMHIAEAVRDIGARLVHISTDFVFNGKQGKPYNPDDIPFPESVYGKTKLEGENAVREVLKTNALIIRTAWLYSAHGENFVKTMIRLMNERDSLSVVDDQIGTPTWAYGLAQTIWCLIKKDLAGLFHWTDAGIASWYDFAVAIQEEGLKVGLLSKQIPINPISTSNYPTPAKRPSFSVLDKEATWQALGMKPVHWRMRLRSMLKEIS